MPAVSPTSMPSRAAAQHGEAGRRVGAGLGDARPRHVDLGGFGGFGALVVSVASVMSVVIVALLSVDRGLAPSSYLSDITFCDRRAGRTMNVRLRS